MLQRRIDRPRQIDQGRQHAADLIAPRRQRAGVAAVERDFELDPRSTGNVVGFEQGRNQGRQRQIDGQAGNTKPNCSFGSQRDDLGVGGRLQTADQFAADLAELPLGAQLVADHAQHFARIGETQRARRVAQARRRDARDLRRQVGANRHGALGDGIEQAENTVAIGLADAGQQAGLVLDQRRLHALIAVRGNRCEGALDDRGFVAGVGREKIVQTLRQQGRVQRVLHGGRMGKPDRRARRWPGSADQAPIFDSRKPPPAWTARALPVYGRPRANRQRSGKKRCAVWRSSKASTASSTSSKKPT